MKNFKAVLTVCIFSLLAGCNPETPTEKGAVTGTAPAGASVIVYTADKDVLAQGKSDQNGHFSIGVEGLKPETLWVKSEGGVIKRLGGKKDSIALSKASGFTGVVSYAAAKENHVNLDFPNTMAAGYTEYLVKNGGEFEESAQKSIDYVSSWLGFRIDLYTNNFLHSKSERELPLKGIVSVLVSEAIMELCDIIEEANSLIDGACTINKIADHVYNDLAYDGVVDAFGAYGDVSVGGVPINGQLLREELAVQILKTTETESEYLGLNPVEIQEFARSISSKGVPVFGNYISQEIPYDNPYLQVEGLDGVVKDKHKLLITVFDYRTVKYLTIIINGKEIILDPATSVYEIDTTLISNGVYLVEIVAVNGLGDRTAVQGNIDVKNKYEIIESISTGAYLVGGEALLQASIRDDQGIESVRHVVDSAIVSSTAGSEGVSVYSVSLDTNKLRDGKHQYQLEVTTKRGNTYSKSKEFYVDNTIPDLLWELAKESQNPNDFPVFPVFERVQEVGFRVVDKTPITKINLYWNDALLKSFNPEGSEVDGSMVYTPSLTVDTRTIYEGIHNLSVEVVDSTGNVSTQERRVIVDWNDPLLKFTTPSGLYIAGPKAFEFQASDTNGFGDAKIKVTKVFELPLSGDESDVFEVEEELSVNGFVKDGVFIIAPEEGEAGVRRLDLEVMDFAGKKAFSSILVNFANVAPTITFRSIETDGDKTKYEIDIYDPFNVDEISSYEYKCWRDNGDIYTRGATFSHIGNKDENSITTLYTNSYTTSSSMCSDKINANPKRRAFTCSLAVTNTLGLTAYKENSMRRHMYSCG